MSSVKSTVIIPAAGYSSRMGELKPVMKIGGKSIIERLITLYTAIPIDTYVVVGWEKERVVDAAGKTNVHIIENADYKEGMLSSIRAGLKCVNKYEYDRVLIHPVDIPLVRAYTIRHLVYISENNPDKIIYPLFESERGHPCIIPGQFVNAILRWSGEGGLRSALEQFGSQFIEAEVADRFINMDMDTAEDFQRLLYEFERYEIPNENECKSILKEIRQLPERVYLHCQAVAELATKIGQKLIQKRQNVDVALITAGAWLHDAGKGSHDHERKGEAILNEMGFPAVAQITSKHSDIGDLKEASLETKVVYLADKLVADSTQVSLEERFNRTIQRYINDIEAINAIKARLLTANTIKAEIETLLGDSIEHCTR